MIQKYNFYFLLIFFFFFFFFDILYLLTIKYEIFDKEIVLNKLEEENNKKNSIETLIPKNLTNDDIVFIHIPKTGGETLEQIFKLKKSHDTICNRLANNLQSNKPKYFITILRNPIERILSWYKFCCEGYYIHSKLKTPNPQSVCNYAKTHNINEFIEEIYFNDYGNIKVDKKNIVFTLLNLLKLFYIVIIS